MLTPNDLYQWGMECDAVGDKLHLLCKALGTPFPPQPNDFTELTGKTQLQNFIEAVEEQI